MTIHDYLRESNGLRICLFNKSIPQSVLILNGGNVCLRYQRSVLACVERTTGLGRFCFDIKYLAQQ